MNKKIYNVCITIILCIVPLFYIPFAGLNKCSFGIKAAILIVCSGILFLTNAINGFEKIDYIDITLLLFLGLNVLSTFFSMDISTSITGLTKSIRYDGVITTFCYVIIYFIAKYRFNGYKNFLKIVFVVSVIICIIAICQFVFHNQTTVSKNYTEGLAKGTIGNSNYMGTYALMFIPTAFCLYFFRGKIKYLGLTLFYVFTMIITTSRSSWVGCFAFGIMLLVFTIKNIKGNKRYVKSLIIIITIIVICFIGVLVIEKFTGNHILSFKIKSLVNDVISLKNGFSEELGTARIKIWKMVIPVIKAKPFLGCGPDNIPIALATYSSAPFGKWVKESKTYIDKAHNDYLQIAACTGIPSLIIYLLFTTLVIRKNKNLTYKNEIIFIMKSTIIAYLVQAFFNITAISVAPLFWFLLGASQNNKFLEKLEEKS